MREFAGTVRLKNLTGARRVTPLDANGTALAEPGAFTGELRLRPDTFYYLISR